MTLTEGLSEEEFLRSRVTRFEASRLALTMAKLLGETDVAVRAQLPEIDWAGWEMLARRIHHRDDDSDGALWFCIQSLLPATVMWLRHYGARRSETSKSP